jgi:hypothetical protein
MPSGKPSPVLYRPVNENSRPSQERRRYRRLSPANVRVRCASGEFEELSNGVDFARRLLNIGLGGMCVETTGRLRPGVKLSAEVRFDEFGGALRTQARVVWVETKKDGGLETHLAGVAFIQPELSAPVREFLEGGRATMIVTKRQAEYEVLKHNAEARKATVALGRWSPLKKLVVTLFTLSLLYVASFGGLVMAGRRESQSPGTHFRYAGASSPGGSLEETLSKVYAPLYWASQRAGIPLTYDSP